MFTKKSRYKNARPFVNDAQGKPDFDGMRAREIGMATGVVEHEIKNDDRLDILARNYYNDDRLWWRIVDANPDIIFGQNIMGKDLAGTVILIPKVKE